MSNLNKKKRSISASLRTYFFTGVVVLIPIGITLYLTKFIIQISSKIIPEEINPNNYLPFSIPGLEILISIIVITLVGGLSFSFIGKKLLQLINDLFKRIPILRTIYSAITQMTETFTNKDDSKRSVVLVEYPRKGTWTLGFVTSESTNENDEEFYHLFVPTTPNPTSGFFLIIPKEDTTLADLNVEEGFRMIVSSGMVGSHKNSIVK